MSSRAVSAVSGRQSSSVCRSPSTRMRGAEPVVMWRSEPRRPTINSSSRVSDGLSMFLSVSASGDLRGEVFVVSVVASDSDPVSRRDSGESLDDRRVELRAGAPAEFREGRLVVLRAAVAAVGSDGVEGVDDGEDARGCVYLVAAQSARIAGAVPLFVVLADDPRRRLRQVGADD